MRRIVFAAMLDLAGCVGAPAQPVYVAPQTVAYGARCFAGFYVCPLGQSLPVGTQCSCPGIGAPSFGVVR